jgi:hypothetical protein
VPADLDEPEPRVEALDRPLRQVGRGHHEGDALLALGVAGGGDHHRPVAPGQAPESRAAHGDALTGDRPRRVDAAQPGQHDGGAGGRVEPQGRQHDGVEGRRRGAGRPLPLEEQRHGGPWVVGQGVAPPQVVEGGVEGRSGVVAGGGLQAGGEQPALVGVHQRSAPRSSRRRATMLRWISALPP